MSVVIIGGNDRMISEYKQICKEYQCKAKVFTQMPGNLKGQIGNPDLLVLFTSTVSHKMINSALKEASKKNLSIARCHSASSTALKSILSDHFIVS
ncbi:DUF2325 domain-containing protein [Clostridium cellulovorans]|uniref:DUF2325 domain-containing protein n=1 Tax=Clostridium cellulovorans (strain ATCC 35296 / DSM 3052 / OCM 3 / 743B) TaxID=573061 RepID=D9SN05_CLOC7|nr:DUF2325 domain-containing protein [Clostridium cellulovorans]ADL51871.1 hypothetical protein Clocel_2128 [Clostridium cellulovorans 743B]